MRRKPQVPFTQKFPHVDPLALRLLERLLAFDPKDRPSAEEVVFRNSNILPLKLFLNTLSKERSLCSMFLIFLMLSSAGIR